MKKVSKAIVKLQPKYIQMPSSAEEIDHCQREFFDIAKFPFVIGCIGCTHIKIQSPGAQFLNKDFLFFIFIMKIGENVILQM